MFDLHLVYNRNISYSERSSYEEKQMEIWKEIEGIQASFPFVAKETLHNEILTEEYMKSLEIRMNSCSENLKELNDEIAKMLGA